MPLDDLIAQGMLWIEDFSEWQVRVIAVLETLAALGLVAPYLIKTLPKIIVPLAAAGLALTMTGAVITHIVRQDPILSIIITGTLLLCCVFLAQRRYKEIKDDHPTATS